MLTSVKKEIFYNAKCICLILKYNDCTRAVQKHVSKNNKFSFMQIKQLYKTKYIITNKKNKIQLSSIYLSVDGVKELLTKSKKPLYLLNIIAKKINTTIKGFNDPINIYIAQDELSKIINVFKREKYILEYAIGKYRIDLYFEEYNLGIECDEYNHIRYDKKSEKIRESYIQHKLNCTIIRFNPHCKDYNVFDIISKIHYFMKKNV